MSFIMNVFGVSIAGLIATVIGLIAHAVFAQKQIAANEAKIEKFLGLPSGEIATTVEGLLPGVVTRLITVAGPAKTQVENVIAAKVNEAAPSIAVSIAPAVAAQVVKVTPVLGVSEDRAFSPNLKAGGNPVLGDRFPGK